MSALTDDTLPVTPRALRDEMILFAVMAVLLGLVPWSGIYPFFVMQALCFALFACASVVACTSSTTESPASCPES